MKQPPYRTVALSLLGLLLLSLCLAAFYLFYLRPAALPYPWNL